MSQKRKTGIGVCGLADLFVQKGIFYDSEEARTLALDLAAFINFESKRSSHELAKARGSFGAMNLNVYNKHLDMPSWLERKYGALKTKYISPEDWQKLAVEIRSSKLLRNVSTTALPPTGRSALTIDASTGIEPIFSSEDYIELHPLIGSKNHRFLQTAKNIPPFSHLLMAASMQKGIDESVSKTVNLPSEATIQNIREIFLTAWELGLKGVSIYREGSKGAQPKRLS